MTNNKSKTPLWKLGLRLSLVFFLITSLLKLLVSILTKDISVYIKTEEFRNYIIILGVFSLIYGFLMASYQKMKHKK